MQGPVHNLAPLVVCLCLVAASGCAEMYDNTKNLMTSTLFKRKTPAELMHVKAPADRIKELKQLAKGAAKKPADEQQRIVDDLAREFQQENNPQVRRQILRTLAVYPVPLAGSVIVGALKDADFETRRAACTSLGVRGGKEAVQELSGVIASDINFDVRIAAVHALGSTEETSALAPLSEALVDPDPAMQAVAHKSLTTVSHRDYGNDVQAWRDYAKTGKTDAHEVSIAERIRRTLF